MYFAFDDQPFNLSEMIGSCCGVPVKVYALTHARIATEQSIANILTASVKLIRENQSLRSKVRSSGALSQLFRPKKSSSVLSKTGALCTESMVA